MVHGVYAGLLAAVGKNRHPFDVLFSSTTSVSRHQKGGF